MTVRLRTERARSLRDCGLNWRESIEQKFKGRSPAADKVHHLSYI